jgi:hypothetical protein
MTLAMICSRVSRRWPDSSENFCEIRVETAQATGNPVIIVSRSRRWRAW